ncbi:hypothetical protein WN51_03735 [Melipona quadrifasciata]|uniref:Uncharacterized protein n=1 Tax=Melipona quadrifasciata TaxID=166423 RepID=A0A0N0U483_9HYME|nr:hypothetical protein WN51_03735 [Melipona quadrifasciata]
MKQLWTKYRRNLQPITICNATDHNLYGTSRKHTELHIELLIVLPRGEQYPNVRVNEDRRRTVQHHFSNSSRVCLGTRKTELQL